jgi:hypothetical protein
VRNGVETEHSCTLFPGQQVREPGLKRQRKLSRRRFIQIAVSAAAAAPAISCSKATSAWRFLTVEEAKTLEAVCAQIIPADQDPGADEESTLEDWPISYQEFVHFFGREARGDAGSPRTCASLDLRSTRTGCSHNPELLNFAGYCDDRGVRARLQPCRPRGSKDLPAAFSPPVGRRAAKRPWLRSLGRHVPA